MFVGFRFVGLGFVGLRGRAAHQHEHKYEHDDCATHG
jgi:hypothetical protein